MKKSKLNENELTKIVYDSVKKLMNEGLFRRTRMEGKPQKISDVLKGNGWKGSAVQNDGRTMVIKCYENNDAVFNFDSSLPFDQLVEDLNIYFQDKGSRIRATAMEEYNGEEGNFIKLVK